MSRSSSRTCSKESSSNPTNAVRALSNPSGQSSRASVPGTCTSSSRTKTQHKNYRLWLLHENWDRSLALWEVPPRFPPTATTRLVARIAGVKLTTFPAPHLSRPYVPNVVYSVHLSAAATPQSCLLKP